MYLQHFGLNEPPFRITPHPEFFFVGAKRGATLEALIYAVLAGEGLIKVVGEVGSGKTMLCRVLVERLPASVDTVYIANPATQPDELMRMIADDLGIVCDAKYTSGRVRDLQAALLERFAAGRQVVILIDEAHAMPTESLEAIRLLSNLDHGHHKLLQIVLFAQPELDSRLARHDLRQLRERVTHALQLAPLTSNDIAEYIDFRLRAAGYRGPELFNKQAIKKINTESEGLTRRINILADKSLMAAFSDQQHLVHAAHVQAAVKDSGFKSLKKKSFIVWTLLMAVLAGGVGASLMTPAHLKIATASIPAALSPQSASQVSEQSFPLLLTESFKNKLAQSRQTFNRAEASNAAIMLLVTDYERAADLEKYLLQTSQLLPEKQLLIYPAEIRGKKGWGVVYGLFTDKAAAQAVMNKLPDQLKKNKPILRTLAGMRDELWNL